MNLPDTFAGGQFDLPPVVAKLVRMAEATTGHEREAAKAQLLKRGYFLDRVGIVWDADNVPESAKDKLAANTPQGKDRR